MPSTSIRLIEVTDAEAIGGHLARDRERLARWDPVRPEGFYTTPHQVGRIEAMLETHAQGRGWPGVIVADGAVIGQVTVSAIVRGSIQKGFLGYWVGSTAQRQGHAGRAVAQVLRVMAEELDLHRAEAHTQMDNLPSHGVLRKNEFTPWGVAHAHTYVNGAWRDVVFWERMLDGGTSPH